MARAQSSGGSSEYEKLATMYVLDDPGFTHTREFANELTTVYELERGGRVQCDAEEPLTPQE